MVRVAKCCKEWVITPTSCPSELSMACSPSHAQVLIATSGKDLDVMLFLSLKTKAHNSRVHAPALRILRALFWSLNRLPERNFQVLYFVPVQSRTKYGGLAKFSLNDTEVFEIRQVQHITLRLVLGVNIIKYEGRIQAIAFLLWGLGNTEKIGFGLGLSSYRNLS